MTPLMITLPELLPIVRLVPSVMAELMAKTAVEALVSSGPVLPLFVNKSELELVFVIIWFAVSHIWFNQKAPARSFVLLSVADGINITTVLDEPPADGCVPVQLPTALQLPVAELV